VSTSDLYCKKGQVTSELLQFMVRVAWQARSNIVNYKHA